MHTILMVDDEAKIRDVVVSYLQNGGFRTLEADTGAKALQAIRASRIDLVVLDLMLPDMTGEEVCQEIRRQSSVPILMLTAKTSETNRIHGLTIGADDYVLKPFDPRELVARVRAILRRSSDNLLLADKISFGYGELSIDTVRAEVCLSGEAVALTPSEYKLLLVLARHPQRYFTRDELVEKVLGFDFEGDARAIDQHVKNIRHKIERDPKQPNYIQTVYGKGYRFTGGES
ncbi:response regulator transcription factor [Paenibacillus contaminans]|uniref:DNA-binding response regulator n=1 Tax=Paenibacillus contaminans TaxID=450362 RepID=A0A329MJ66_9BACL|nr:response regulator transcription factor [Paenibacillus contaminans]RAV18773.1 DNA-binding response regulator [Paenibacillus contaminans]